MNRRVEATPPEYALAAEMFDYFCAAGTMKQIVGLHREIYNTLNLKPNRLPEFYPKLKAKLSSSWKAQALFKKFDARANHKVYDKGRASTQTRVLIIGAGPCGLRAAIECQLLGAKVVVIEKRDRMSRNNVLHLWPFVIQDLRALGAKKFFGKFCAGSIDHISIRQLQCILLKVSLLLGVEFHEGVSFEELLEPTVTDNNEKLGWRARVLPSNHPVNLYEFDVLIGADGKRNTLPGFKRKEFRGKLAMAITANFINRHTEQEASVPEISGVAFIFNQKWFKELYQMTGIDLENIVYYKDDTHYFVMTAKKHSLLEKGVLLNDYSEVSRLLSVENVDRAALIRYAQEAARYATGGRLPLRDFALNHYGEPDVALFDFTSMYAAENASVVYERHGHRLLCQLVGDSLLEPFWPTGSGCARGFLSALDAAWAVRTWSHTPTPHPLKVVAERESIFRLLAQTTPENLHRDLGAYTLDPCTRYPNLNKFLVAPERATAFYDTDDPLPMEAVPVAQITRKRDSEISERVLSSWVGVPELRTAISAPALAAAVRRYRPDLLPHTAPSTHVYHVLHQEFGIGPPSPMNGGGSVREVPDNKVRSYLSRVYATFKGEVPHLYHVTDVFHQLKQQTDRHLNNDHPLSAYSNAAETDKSHSPYKRKRRARVVSTDPADCIRRQIGRLDLDEVTTLARLIDGHDHLNIEHNDHAAKQRALQDEILALFDPEDSPDPALLRESLSRLLQGKTETRIAQDRNKLAHFFHDDKQKPTRPQRRLKGLDPNTIRVPDYDLDESADTDATVVRADAIRERNVCKNVSKNRRSSDVVVSKDRRPSDGVERLSRRSPSVERSKRSASVGATEARRIAQLFEKTERKRRTPERPTPVSEAMAARVARAHAALHGPIVDVGEEQLPRRPSIGAPELETRRRRVVELMSGHRGGGGGRRRVQRDVTRARVARSVALLASDQRQTSPAPPPSADLTHDVGLQQYRASAPHFDDRVRHLERQLQHYEEGRIVGGGGRSSSGVGGGARVARLAAELSGQPTPAPAAPRPNKPKDLMRSVGKIEPDDWHMKKIERKIMENRLGRPEPRTAEKVPKWDREQFLGRQRKLKEGDGSDEKWGEIDETLHKFDQKLKDSGRPDHGTKKVAKLATKFVKKDPDPEPTKNETNKEEAKKGWRGPTSAGVQCASCGTRVFAAEGVTADGLTLHRGCFRCAICRTMLRPGNYTMERYGSRLVCLRHGGVAPGASVPDAAPGTAPGAPAPSRLPLPTPERISIELSDSGAREIDEDEWTDRNCLASETSAANNASDDEDSSSDDYTEAIGSEDEDGGMGARAPPSPLPHRVPTTTHAHQDIYLSDDSFGYDDYSDDGGESSGGESCSRMRALREARRREVPAALARPPTDSSEPEASTDSINKFYESGSESLPTAGLMRDWGLDVESEEESSSEEESASSATEVSTDSEFARDEGHLPAILVTPAPPPAPPAPPHPPPASRDYPLSRALSTGGLATQRALELKRRYLLGEPSPPAVRKSDSTSQIDTKLAAFTNNITEFQKMLNPAPVVPASPATITTAYHAKVDPQPMPDIIKNLCGAAPVDLLAKTDTSLLHDYISERSEPGSESARLEPDDEDAALESDSLSERTERESSRAPVPRLEVHDDSGELVHLDSLTSGADDLGTGTGTASTVVPATTAANAAATTPVGDDSSSSHEASTLALTESSASSWAGEGSALEAAGAGRRGAPRHLARLKSVRAAPELDAHICGRSDRDANHGAGDAVRFENASDHFAFADEGEGEPEPVQATNLGYMELVDDEYSPARDRSMDFIERTFSETVYRPTPVPPAPASRTEIVHTLPPVTYLDNEQLSPTKTDTESSERTIGESKPGRDDSDSRTEGELRGRGETTSNTSGRSTAGLEPSIDSLSLSPVASPPLASPSESTAPAVSACSGGVGGGAGAGGECEPEAGRMARLRRERDHQTEVVRRLVLARLGGDRAPRRRRGGTVPLAPPPVPPPPAPVLVPVPAPVVPVAPAFSDPELARASPRRNTIMRTISVYINKHLHPRHKEPVSHVNVVHKSTGALQEAPQEAPPVPPPPAGYCPPPEKTRFSPVIPSKIPVSCESERDAMQLWFEARWARLVAQRRARDDRGTPAPLPADDGPAARRLAKLERRLSRPLSAEQQAATVAELVQVSAARDAHQALINADRRRSAASGGE